MIPSNPSTKSAGKIEADNSHENYLLSDDYVEKLRNLVSNRWDDIWNVVRDRHQESASE